MLRKSARLKQLLGSDGALIELNRALSDKIAKGEVDLQTPGLAEHLWQTTMDKLAVDQPNYASYKRELGNQVGWVERSQTHPSSVVVPANAGTHTPRPIGKTMVLIIFIPLASVAMGPCVRRDDGR